MPIFGEASSPYDEIVEKVTNETLTTENWALMMDICDDVLAKGQRASKQCLISVKKRLNHRDPHVVLFALSLLDCLWNNCDAAFRREVSSKEFIGELSYKATGSNRVVSEKTLELIKKWSENECKKDSSLSLVESLYKDLLNEGYTFEVSSKTESKKTTFLNNPYVVTTEQEEADIAKAIALSLNDSKDTKKGGQTMYPSSFDAGAYPQVNVLATQNLRQVKSLYDFEAVEDNELSFVAGELITVLDDSDQNWWRGSSARGSGLFPASFVTTNLAPSPSSNVNEKQNGNDESNHQQKQQLEEPPKVEIDEDILLKCFQLLQDCDPTGEVSDPPELAYYEQMSLAQAVLIDQKLAQIDKQHNMLAKIDVSIRDVLANYDNAVQQVQYQMQHTYITPAALPPNSSSMNNVASGMTVGYSPLVQTSASQYSTAELQQQHFHTDLIHAAPSSSAMCTTLNNPPSIQVSLVEGVPGSGINNSFVGGNEIPHEQQQNQQTFIQQQHVYQQQ